MQLAVVLFVEAGGFLEVVVHRIGGDRQAVVLGDPALLLGCRRFEVDPHGAHAGQGVEALDLFLEQPAVGQREDIEHAYSDNRGGVVCRA